MITNIINFFQRLYQDNPSVAAILGVSSAGIVTSIIYICRSKIQSFFCWIKKQFTTTFLITNDGGTSEVYGLILKWLKKYNKLYTRSLTAPQQLDVDELSRDKISGALQYGLGRHLIWFHKRPIWLHIYEEKLENSRERKLYLSMSIIGRSHNLIYDLLDEVYKWNKSEEIEANKDKTRVNIYGYSGIDSWEIIRKRGFDTIYLSSKIEAEIKHNIQKFLDNEKIYVQHGIPYHYGMILYGPPGTGKTSIIKAIASEFDFDISLIDPLKFDITRLREKRENDKIKLLVIEDIDLLLGTKRETVEDIDIDEEEDIIGETIKVDRILYEEYELKKTMTVFDVGEYSLFFANGEDGQKRIFLLDNGYYLLDRVNATNKEIILQVKEYLGKNSSPYFNGVNDEKQKLGIIEDKKIKYDVKIPRFYCNNKATFLKDEEGVEYSLIYTENDKLSVFIDDIRKKIIGIRKYTPRLEGHILDSVLFYCNEDDDYLYFSYYKSDKDNEEIEYDVKISKLYLDNRSIEAIKDDNGVEYVATATDYNDSRDYLTILRDKDAFIQSIVDINNCGGVYKEENNLYYCGEDEEYFYFKYQNKIKENDYIKFSKNQLLIDCKQFAGKIYSESDDKEYDLVQFEDYVPHSMEALISAIKKDMIQLAYTEVVDSKPVYYDLYYKDDDDEYIYFYQKRCIERDGLLTSDYDEQGEGDYDIKMPIGILKEMFKRRHCVYSFLVHDDYIGGHYKKELDSIRLHKLYLWDESKDKVYEYSGEDKYHFYFIYSEVGQQQPRVIMSGINDEYIIEDKNEEPVDSEYSNIEENDKLELTEEKLTEVLQSKNKRYTTFETVSACIVGSPINGIRSGDIGIIDKDISVEENKWKVYTYNREDEKRFYFDYSLKLSTEANDILPKWKMRHARQEYNERHKINELKENYDLKFTIEEIEELIEKWNKNKSYPNYSLFFSRDTLYDKCISPRVVINDIRYNKAGIIDSKESKSTNNWVVYTYVEEDEDYFYFNYSPKMSAEMNRDVTKPIGAKNQEELVEEQKLDYDYSIPINILEGNSWEKPFATNEGNNLYIWQSGMNNPIENIPSQGIKFVKHLIAENLYFYDTPKSVNFTKAYRYVSHDENNIYIKEIANYKKPQIIKGDPFGEEFEIAKSTDSKDFAPIKSRPKTKVITSGKDSAGKKVLRDLMNAIDGLITKENFIIIATTNSIESLDPALIRPGRFDTAIKIDYIDIEVFNKAMMRYFGKTVEGTLKKKNLTISRLQVEFLMGKTFEDFKRKYIK